METQYPKQIQVNSDKQITVRYPTLDDLDEMVRYVNQLSQEDTFVIFSGEEITREEEERYLQEILKECTAGNGVYLLCFDGNTLIGSSGVYRDRAKRERSKHRGIFGISISREYRGLGIGKKLMGFVLTEATNCIAGLKQITLQVYAPNEKAIKMYESFGFKEVGRIPEGAKFHGEYVDEITMWKQV